MKKNDQVIVNRVAKSKIITIDLEEYLNDYKIIAFDLKDFLFREMILREKDFRLAMDEYDWTSVEDKVLWVYCSVDAVIPLWAYMLISSKAKKYAGLVFDGDEKSLNTHLILKKINGLDIELFEDKPVIVKGCGSKPISAQAYVAITDKIQESAKSIMFGEPCSTVPIYKQKK